MKQILLIRHAKSSWDQVNLDDRDRSLTHRGKQDAFSTGKLLKEKEFFPQLIISSKAKRARKTAVKISHELNYPKKKIELSHLIYDGTFLEITDFICKIDKTIDLVFIVGHNPSLMELANYLTGSNFVKFKTSGFLLIDMKIKSWKDVNQQIGKVNFAHKVK